ncbi:MAG: hypothetical protein ACPG8A_06925 [Psychrobium sp.]
MPHKIYSLASSFSMNFDVNVSLSASSIRISNAYCETLKKSSLTA